MISRIVGFKGFLNEVVIELKKCSWPTWPELRQSTIVVIIGMLILGGFVGIADFILNYIVKLMFFQQGGGG